MSLTRIVTRNWRLKTAALALAVLLWITMRLSDDSVSSFVIPDVAVRVEQLDPDWVLRGPPSPALVEMTVTGPYGELLRVALAEPLVVIPMQSAEQEDVVLELDVDWVRNVDRTNVGIEGFAPSSIRLLLERNRVVEVPVSVGRRDALPIRLRWLANRAPTSSSPRCAVRRRPSIPWRPCFSSGSTWAR